MFQSCSVWVMGACQSTFVSISQSMYAVGVTRFKVVTVPVNATRRTLSWLLLLRCQRLGESSGIKLSSALCPFQRRRVARVSVVSIVVVSVTVVVEVVAAFDSCVS